MEATGSLYVNGVKVGQFKVKDWEIKPYPLCLGNISKNFKAHNMKKLEAGLNVYNFLIH